MPEELRERLPDGAVPSPNIWHHTDVYEIENRAVDPEGLIEAAMRAVHDWAGADVLDLGCGSGFHLPRFARAARTVTGVEPHPDLRAIAARRTRRLRALRTVRVLEGTAQATGLPDASVDVVHARWAYFFGPGCEPGLAELARVVRPGGTAFVIDNDPTRSTFGSWFRRGYPEFSAAHVVERFWADQGFHREPVMVRWEFDAWEDLEAVVRIELPGTVADEALAEQRATGTLSVDYAVNVFSRTY
ncbi:class I SAM-dependent methyltransferase [Nocardioides bruguierae]|uniref:Class I SAM-dependent methyltransferase n=1 Tax=Nocardioides bruguierae TaxID=2945102 RepID=A0A9X2IHE2_9ACTN|nr:class I SAM-dependent methyltransferase [Nocardioides bruguierae]MCM0621700.1 class I SAM-dependent methyltransferase [Nocardioides bruguierae]